MRVTYPLVPFAAVHFGVSLETATWLVTAQVLASLLSPIGGLLSDRRGFRSTMTLGLGIVVVGTFAMTLGRTLAAVALALGVVGFGIAIYLPAMQAYVSSMTPFAQRGRALGIVELSWSMAGIFGVVPLITLVERTGDLRVAYTLLALLILIMTVLNHILLPVEQRPIHSKASPVVRRSILIQPSVIALLLFLWLVMAGQETNGIKSAEEILQDKWASSGAKESEEVLNFDDILNGALGESEKAIAEKQQAEGMPDSTPRQALLKSSPDAEPTTPSNSPMR